MKTLTLRVIHDFLSRPLCYLFGCRCEHPQGYVCDRCGEYLYEGWIEPGVLAPLLRGWHDLSARFRPARCANCGNRTGWTWRRREWPDFCSAACEKGWIPF